MRTPRTSTSNGVRKISASFTTTLALLVGSNLLTSAHQASNPSPSLLVRTNFQHFPFAEENQCMMDVCCDTLQLSTRPILESKIQLSRGSLISSGSALAQSTSRRSNSATVASSPGRASTDLMISCTRCNRPAQERNTRDHVTPTSVFAIEVLLLVSCRWSIVSYGASCALAALLPPA